MTSLPANCFLLDIEGTTSSISFVHDVMFPFALNNLEQFLADHWDAADTQSACEQIASDAEQKSLQSWSEATDTADKDLVIAEVRRLMADDVKATGLKALQGLIWKGGFDSGALKAHIYPDVIPAIEAWRAAGADVRIYSSGSIAAQKMFFGNLDGPGDCLHLFSGHYDTTIGGKKERESYTQICEDWGVSPSEILFLSDVPEELTAATEAGLQTRLSIRPGNKSVPPEVTFQSIESFEEVS
ncbi:MAG: acireductone synthase [Planctomycetota bacterium]|nr:acireductone synthase [Planctomycetota bacterium]